MIRFRSHVVVLCVWTMEHITVTARSIVKVDMFRIGVVAAATNHQ